MLLYLVKHLHLDLANATREELKAKTGVNPAAYKELLCVIRNVLDSKNLGFKIEPTGNSNKHWEIFRFSDSDYAGDWVSRQSISGFILYVLSVPVSWQSKLQKSVSLSRSEVKYIAFFEAVKEQMFVVQLLRSKKMLVNSPFIVRVEKCNIHHQ